MKKYDDILEAIEYFKRAYERIDKDYNDDDTANILYYYAIAINALREQLPEK